MFDIDTSDYSNIGIIIDFGNNGKIVVEPSLIDDLIFELSQKKSLLDSLYPELSKQSKIEHGGSDD